jgi:hypothetical protein
MKHPSNCELFTYWNVSRGNRLAPERADIEPGAIRRVLGDTFVLEVDGRAKYPFRIAGTRLCALFARELKGESFVGLWQKSAQTTLREMMTVVVEEKIGVVASAAGQTADEALLPIGLELMLLPLGYRTRSEARLLGALAPLAAPYWLGVKATGPLSLGMFRHIGGAVDTATPHRFRAASGRLKHGLTVYDGGRAE